MRSALVCGSLLVVAAFFSIFPLMALDLPLHLKMGEIILHEGRVPPTNVVLHTQERTRYVNDKWLHQVLVHVVERAGGPTGLHLLRLALLLGLMLSTWWLVRQFAGAEAAGLAVLTALALFVHRLSLRPELWTYLFTALFLVILLGPGRRRPRLLLLLVPLQILWVNLHIYFPLGVGLCALVSLPEIARRRFRVTGLAVLLAAACLLNPAGLDGWLQPFRVAASLRALSAGAISETAPAWSLTLPWTLPRIGLLAGAAAVLIGLVRARFRLPAGIWLTAAPLIAVGLVPHRNLPLAGLGLALLLAAAPPLRHRSLLAAVPAVCLAAVVLILTGPLEDPTRERRRFGTGWSEQWFPIRSAEFLVAHRPAGEVFNDIACGGYYVYRAYPQKRAFIDGNTSGYPISFLEEHRKVLALEIPHRALTRKYRVTHFLLRHDAPATRNLIPVLFRDEGLILAFFDPVSTVFLAREVAPGVVDHRPEWLEQVLPRVRDGLFARRRRAKPLLDQAAKLMTDRPETALDLVRQALAFDPWEARVFRISAMIYRHQKKPALEVHAWRGARLLEGQPLGR